MIKEINNFWGWIWFVIIYPTMPFNILRCISFTPYSIGVFLNCIIQKKNSRCIGAYHNNNLIGLLIYDKMYDRINYLYIKKHFRNKGIGKELVKTSNCFAVYSQTCSLNYWKSLGYSKQVDKLIWVRG